MRNILLIGAVLGASASVPIVYQASPDTFHALLRPAPADPGVDVSAIAPPAPKRTSQSQSLRRVSIPADASGHFLTDVKINGRRVEGLIDTGATYVALNETAARRLGVSVARSDFRHEVSTANGKARAAVVMLDSIEIGRIGVSDIEAVILEDRALGNILIGMNVLSRIGRVEVADGVLHLEQ